MMKVHVRLLTIVNKNLIILFRFPKAPDIRKKWIDACELHEKDVPHIYICSYHFELPDNLVALKRLPPGAISTVEIAVPNTQLNHQMYQQ